MEPAELTVKAGNYRISWPCGSRWGPLAAHLDRRGWGGRAQVLPLCLGVLCVSRWRVQGHGQDVLTGPPASLPLSLPRPPWHQAPLGGPRLLWPFCHFSPAALGNPPAPVLKLCVAIEPSSRRSLTRVPELVLPSHGGWCTPIRVAKSAPAAHPDTSARFIFPKPTSRQEGV
jgi:hypothetical protein